MPMMTDKEMEDALGPTFEAPTIIDLYNDVAEIKSLARERNDILASINKTLFTVAFCSLATTIAVFGRLAGRW